MPITALDAILVVFTLLSAILAMIRGFSRELLSVASWALAGFIAYTFHESLKPWLEPYIDNPQIVKIIAAGIIFLITLITFTAIAMKIADVIVDSFLGALDRTLGFVYGAARGILVVAIGLFLLSWLSGKNEPVWVLESKSRPFLEKIIGWIQNLTPELKAFDSILEQISPLQKMPQPSGKPNEKPENPPTENEKQKQKKGEEKNSNI